MDDFNVLKYQPVIKDVMAKLKVRKNQQEDLLQECYLALLEHQDKLESADNDLGYAATVSRRTIQHCWSKEHFGVADFSDIKDNPPKVRFDSLSEPKTARRAAKVAAPSPAPDFQISSLDLEEAVSKLSEKERQTVQLLLEDKTQQEVADVLGVHLSTITRRSRSAIQKLKAHFGEE
jgi:RNA polymerase sigma factor (sigma-70 family)